MKGMLELGGILVVCDKIRLVDYTDRRRLS